MPFAQSQNQPRHRHGCSRGSSHRRARRSCVVHSNALPGRSNLPHTSPLARSPRPIRSSYSPVLLPTRLRWQPTDGPPSRSPAAAKLLHGHERAHHLRRHPTSLRYSPQLRGRARPSSSHHVTATSQPSFGASGSAAHSTDNRLYSQHSPTVWPSTSRHS